MIAGRFRSRVLEAPEGLATRPTSDRLRETLFNVLAPRIDGARFLDLYAGSGAVGIEALSRGATEVVFVERGTAALDALRRNLQKLGIRGEAHVQPEPVSRFLLRSENRFDLVFLDPPYEEVGEYEATLRGLGRMSISPRPQNRGLGRPSLRDPTPPKRSLDGVPMIEILAEGGLVVAEHRRKDRLKELYGDLVRTRVLEQGDAALSFYQRIDKAAS